jgi:hypothetical protein
MEDRKHCPGGCADSASSRESVRMRFLGTTGACWTLSAGSRGRERSEDCKAGDAEHSRREQLWLGVTAHPSPEWIARQLTEAYGWHQAPRYIIRDRDRVYGGVFARRLRAMGIRDRPIAARSPWQNGCAERLIGSVRRDCLDHVVVFGERHLRHLLKSYQKILQRGPAPHPLIPAEGRAVPPAVQSVGQTLAVKFWAGCTTNISEREFPTGTGNEITI